jgi:hypothetical protein
MVSRAIFAVTGAYYPYNERFPAEFSGTRYSYAIFVSVFPFSLGAKNSCYRRLPTASITSRKFPFFSQYIYFFIMSFTVKTVTSKFLVLLEITLLKLVNNRRIFKDAMSMLNVGNCVIVEKAYHHLQYRLGNPKSRNNYLTEHS